MLPNLSRLADAKRTSETVSVNGKPEDRNKVKQAIMRRESTDEGPISCSDHTCNRARRDR